jgi:hypothetical protein
MRRRLISRLETPSAKCLDIPLGSVLGTHDYLNRDFRTALLGLAFERECCNGCFLVYIHVNRYYAGKWRDTQIPHLIVIEYHDRLFVSSPTQAQRFQKNYDIVSKTRGTLDSDGRDPDEGKHHPGVVSSCGRTEHRELHYRCKMDGLVLHLGHMICNLAHKLGFLSFMGRAFEGKIRCREQTRVRTADLTRVRETLIYPPNTLGRPTDTGSILTPRA